MANIIDAEADLYNHGRAPALKRKAGVSDELRDTWRKNKTARHRQIADTIRMAFKLRSQGSSKGRGAERAAHAARGAGERGSHGTSVDVERNGVG